MKRSRGFPVSALVRGSPSPPGVQPKRVAKSVQTVNGAVNRVRMQQLAVARRRGRNRQARQSRRANRRG